MGISEVRTERGYMEAIRNAYGEVAVSWPGSSEVYYFTPEEAVAMGEVLVNLGGREQGEGASPTRATVRGGTDE